MSNIQIFISLSTQHSHILTHTHLSHINTIFLSFSYSHPHTHFSHVHYFFPLSLHYLDHQDFLYTIDFANTHFISSFLHSTTTFFDPHFHNHNITHQDQSNFFICNKDLLHLMLARHNMTLVHIFYLNSYSKFNVDQKYLTKCHNHSQI